MQAYHISSVTVVDPSSPFSGEQVDLQVRDGKIVAIGPAGSLKASADMEELKPGADVRVSPGWVDMQVCLQDPGHEYKETLEELAEAAIQGGFTSILCYPEVDPVPDRASVIKGLMRQTQSLDLDIMLAGHATEGGAGKELTEMYDMHLAGAVAFTDGLQRPANAGALLRILRYMKAFDGLLLLSAMDNKLVPDGQMNEGTQSVRLGMKGIPEVAETMAVAADLELLSYESGRVHYQPVTSVKALTSIIAHRIAEGLSGLTTGIPLHYLIHSDEELSGFDSVLKVMPPLRSASQRDELKTNGLGEQLIDVITSGHKAQGIEEKQLEFSLADPGMLGLQTFYPLAQQHLVESGYLSEEALIMLISLNPREILGKERVSLIEGGMADLTFFSPTVEWTLEAKDIPSQAKNSPYIGQNLKGKVWGVMTGGKLHTPHA